MDFQTLENNLKKLQEMISNGLLSQEEGDDL
jgi:hypothetical protein